MKGIDVSNWQGTVDWERVAAAGYSFAFIKASQGASYADPTFKRNVSGAHKAGLKIGGYHFANFFDPASAQKEARYFWSIVKGQPLDLALMLDLEVNHAGGQLVTSMFTFFTELKQLSGKKVGLYSMGYFYLDNLRGHHPGIPLWYAQYAYKPLVTTYAAWQHCSDARVPGIAGDVDENVSGADFNSLLLNPLEATAVGARAPVTAAVKTTSYFVTTDRLNIRKSPNGAAIGTLNHGDKVRVISISGGWAALKSNNSQVYVAAAYLSQQVSKPAPKSAPAVYHIVTDGDTVGRLAAHYGVSISQIKSWNHLNSKYTIYLKQKIRVK
ncbi:GH25 family lysozyme [Sporolactobacillus pectinivorans]|uniref:GH25 family lysozyme n=1 Tax=Sporolactobacillus pectinivorans TaxID=1591408 RepID=UPI00138FC9A7|nr:GH25 family lysozyme [Sporolactobacillus pectinivorans]